jgi:anionic cell wall polymer biosynthesis LytR-Cps2A-Psr (LCP) family protein
MLIRVSDESLLPELLSFPRDSGCIAYYSAGADEIEAIYPHVSGEREMHKIRNLLTSWRVDHPGIGMTARAE